MTKIKPGTVADCAQHHGQLVQLHNADGSPRARGTLVGIELVPGEGAYCYRVRIADRVDFFDRSGRSYWARGKDRLELVPVVTAAAGLCRP